MKEPIIRPLTRDEIDLVKPCLEKLAVHHNEVARTFAGVYPTMPIDVHIDHMKEHVENRTALILGLFVRDGGLEGFGMASHEGSYGEIDYLYVRKSRRGGGYGEALLDRLLAYLKENGVDFVDLRVVLGNPAKRFYAKHGFQVRTEVMSKRI